MEVNVWYSDFYAPDLITFNLEKDTEDASDAPFTEWELTCFQS